MDFAPYSGDNDSENDSANDSHNHGASGERSEKQ